MNALSSEQVGNYLATHFVSAFQKVGTFRIEAGQKQGGNVASYFVTAQGQVLHVLPGPVDAATFLREARWAVETWKLSALEKHDEPARKAFFAKSHADRLYHEYGEKLEHLPNRSRLTKEAQAHALLANTPLPRIEQIYAQVFEDILGEKISSRPVVEASRRAGSSKITLPVPASVCRAPAFGTAKTASSAVAAT